MELVIFGKEMILIGEFDGDEAGLKAVLVGYVEQQKEMNARNWEVYHTMYRERFEMPETVRTVDEEGEYIIEKYGSQPLENPAFVEILQEVNTGYDMLREEPEPVEAWAEKNNIKLRLVSLALQYS